MVHEMTPSDSIEDLTVFLHRAYASLAQRGLRYVATHQDPQTTRRRIAGGDCLLGTREDGRLVGTITFKRTVTNEGCEWYRRQDVAYCGQLGVDPELQGHGVGSLLMDLVEERAWRAGATEIALDTSERAEDLIAWYERRRYRVVENVDWATTNYRSVVLSKNLQLPSVIFRKMQDDDALLVSMLAEAVNWDPGRPRIGRAELLGRQDLRRYVEGWGRLGDEGVVAEDGAGCAIGAAWYRTFPANDAGFGYVADHIPEASIAVRRPWRCHGLGHRLLAELERRARLSGVQALSLSVEDSNPAVALYSRRRYRVVARLGRALTMTRDLAVQDSKSPG